MIENVAQALADDADDKRSAGRAECHDRFAFFENNQRRHAAARTFSAKSLSIVPQGRLARLALRVKRIGAFARIEIEVGQFVVEDETQAGNDDATAHAVLDGGGAGDDVALRID